MSFVVVDFAGWTPDYKDKFIPMRDAVDVPDEWVLNLLPGFREACCNTAFSLKADKFIAACKSIIPIFLRQLPIIMDEYPNYPTLELGNKALKVCVFALFLLEFIF
jgi:hypothetical protein